MSDPYRWSEPLPTMTVIEQEKQPHTVIYDHTGQPYARPRQPMGFIDPNNLPTGKRTSRK